MAPEKARLNVTPNAPQEGDFMHNPQLEDRLANTPATELSDSELMDGTRPNPFQVADPQRRAELETELERRETSGQPPTEPRDLSDLFEEEAVGTPLGTVTGQPVEPEGAPGTVERSATTSHRPTRPVGTLRPTPPRPTLTSR